MGYKTLATRSEPAAATRLVRQIAITERRQRALTVTEMTRPVDPSEIGSGDGALCETAGMAGILIGYDRVSTDAQDLTAQHNALTALGVDPKRVYVDQCRSGSNRDRPGLARALAACRAGDTLVVTKLDRVARSLPDARDISAELAAADVRLSLGGAVHEPMDPVGRLLFNVLAMVAEFESD
jgi:hypothetical protein